MSPMSNDILLAILYSQQEQKRAELVEIERQIAVEQNRQIGYLPAYERQNEAKTVKS